MKIFYEIDYDGYYKDTFMLEHPPYLIEDGEDGEESINPLFIDTPIPNDVHFSGIYPPKWDGEKWINGATQEEIDELTKPQPQEPTIEERLEQTEVLLQTVTMAFTEYVFTQEMGDDS